MVFWGSDGKRRVRKRMKRLWDFEEELCILDESSGLLVLESWILFQDRRLIWCSGGYDTMVFLDHMER